MGNAADPCDLRGDFGSGQESAHAWFGALAQFDFDGANWVGGHRLLETTQVEVALRISAAEISGAQLPNQLAAMLMVGRHAAFACIVQAPGQLTAAIECFDCLGAERSEAHRRQIDDGIGAKCLSSSSVFAQHLGTRDGVRCVRSLGAPHVVRAKETRPCLITSVLGDRSRSLSVPKPK